MLVHHMEALHSVILITKMRLRFKVNAVDLGSNAGSTWKSECVS